MKWIQTALWVGLASNLLLGTALGQVPELQKAMAAGTDSGRVENYKSIDPTTAQRSSSPSSSWQGIVAFSVQGSEHASSGEKVLLGYPSTYTNEGGGWAPGGGTFIAPSAGLYIFTVSFVKEPYLNGTADDVYVFIYQNGASKGYAWAGQGATLQRTAGTHTVALVLGAGDYVQTFAYSDAGLPRHIYNYSFTGYLVKQRD
ncbi:hypothetical protein F0U62_27150 [Cystobacter fuscus]|uniref:C1q-like domain-containing protein n=1 Tax=Cystobacter fuscus TaxID=43 RepID=UPI002B2AEEA9|nr:hypothetical protein F0U62_27150 [Cystobacter fuscus]